jgi:hypothetical protein
MVTRIHAAERWRSPSRGGACLCTGHATMGAVRGASRSGAPLHRGAWLGALLLAVGCACACVGAGGKTATEGAAAATSSASADALAHGASASTSGTAAAAAGVNGSAASATTAAATTAPAPPPFAPGTVRCGERSCQAGTETCCLFGKDSGCAPTAAGNREPELLKQSQQCMDRVKSDVALSGIVRCDDAADCGPKETCCRSEPLGGVALSLCMPFTPGRSGCDLGERCVPDVACKTPGTSCIAGHCRLAGTPTCMGKTCDAGAPMCCGKFDWQGKPSCRAAGQCPTDANVYECFRPSDCPKGETCQSLMTGTRCLGKVPTTSRMVVCEKDADCPKGMCSASPREANEPPVATAPSKKGPGGGPRDDERNATCAPNERDGWSNLLTCQCPRSDASP